LKIFLEICLNKNLIMIIFHIFTIFPNIFSSYFNESILKRAQGKNIIKIKIYNIRDFAKDKHKTTDDRPYGGGPGMVMKIEPLLKAVISVLKQKNKQTKIIIFSAGGKQFKGETARKWASKYKNIIFICGHYEGIDARLNRILKSMKVDVEEVSIGPYILSGGELAAMVVVDAISRHIPGVLGKIESLEENKGSYPVYTRPEVFSAGGGSAFGGKGKKYCVPKVLLSGDHKQISGWRMNHGKIK